MRQGRHDDILTTWSGVILYLRKMEDSERALAGRRTAMESGANHITAVCDAA